MKEVLRLMEILLQPEFTCGHDNKVWVRIRDPSTFKSCFLACMLACTSCWHLGQLFNRSVAFGARRNVRNVMAKLLSPRLTSQNYKALSIWCTRRLWDFNHRSRMYTKSIARLTGKAWASFQYAQVAWARIDWLTPKVLQYSVVHNELLRNDIMGNATSS